MMYEHEEVLYVILQIVLSIFLQLGCKWILKKYRVENDTKMDWILKKYQVNNITSGIELIMLTNLCIVITFSQYFSQYHCCSLKHYFTNKMRMIQLIHFLQAHSLTQLIHFLRVHLSTLSD